ncbi:hypothetical protein IHE44_0008295 [Lamprotornis superbus]|uniref:Immunoglobulin-like and fibronectin type III domain-containing protein 1 n=1 Tax=Lamprotornis superbus TaxID=245042 RepID=A0A835TSM0_9PASS|nr:hypothetical protein IHE44_0008295 [Lamprotornis superbus]
MLRMDFQGKNVSALQGEQCPLSTSASLGHSAASQGQLSPGTQGLTGPWVATALAIHQNPPRECHVVNACLKHERRSLEESQKAEQSIMSSQQTVKMFKKSAIPGVVITQFVNDVPQGCSTPDFEKKPLTLTLQEGKNAIFRAVVKGVPAPEVKWSRMRKGMDDPAKYEMSFNSATNEFILQIKSLVLDDSDLYRCCAVNAYGEASCCAGLRILQELKKTLLDSKKLLRKRVVAPKPKPLDKEAVWQLLLHADKRDYEKICMKYGIVDFRGMLRKLQEVRKDTETEQDKLIHNLKNFEHIKVNKEGNAMFSLEMELKNRNSNVYLLKDGERLRYGTGDEYRKHCLRRVGRRYYFTVNDVQPEDAGVYQVRVEDVPVFSTELDAQAIPVRFRQPLSDVRCAEAADAEFQCELCTPCHEPLWLHKSHPLQASDKYQMSVTPDGLTHKLTVRNVGPSDSGLYTLEVGQGSSSAWLLVEYAKGKRRQDEGEKIERETSEWLKEAMADNERARKLRRQEQAAAEDHSSFSTSSGVEKSGWYRTGQGSSQDRGQGHSIGSDDGSQRFLGKEGLHKTHINGEVGSGQFSGAGLDGDSAANDGSIFGLKGLEGRRLRPVHSVDSVSGRAGPGVVGGAGEWNSVDGRGEGVLGVADIDMDDGEGLGSQHDKDGNLGEEAMGSGHGMDAMLSRAPGYAGGEGFSGEGSALWGAGSPYGKDRGSAVAMAGTGGVGRLGGDEWGSVSGKGGVGGAGGAGAEYGLDAHLGRSLRGETGKGIASDVRGSAGDGGSLSGPGGARGEGRDFRQLGSLYGTNSAFGEAGSKSHDRSVDGSSSSGFGQGPLSYGQMSGPCGGPPSENQKNQEPDLDLKANDSLKNTESTGQKRRSVLDDLKVPRCYLNKQLATVRVLKGDPAELSCTVSKDNVTGTWFKDGLKLTSMDGVVFEKKGLVHKLIINKAEDIHAGKYRFEGGDVKTEASIFVEDPPQVDKVLLKNLTSVPTVAKAGEGVKLRIPFEGRGPIRAAWLKDSMELGNDTRIRVDKTDTCTTLSISSCDRRDCGDYKVRLKNDSGVLEINLKLMVIDKPQPPAGPIKIVERSANNITIQWKPPKDDGGKPVQRYLVERQQMGRNDWETLGETPRSCTSFTTSKVEEEMSYYFRVRAVNAEGVSDALESEEVKAAGKASPGAPDPPKIISTSRDTITISWKAPCKTGASQILGYIVQKRKKGTVTWLPVTNVPVKDKKLKVPSLKKGVQYEFRVAAVNAAGTGQPSDPSEPAFAQDPTKSPGQVQDLKVSTSDGTSVTLTWNKPEVQNGNDVKGYEVEMRPCNSLSWTKCFTLPAESTLCRVQGLQPREKLFLRVRALGDGGPGEPSELEACAGAAAAVVSPRLLIDDTVKSFLLIKAGNPIRVKIPFEGSPEPVVTWLKDGLPLPSQAVVSTEDGSTQLLLRAAEFSDSGTYTVQLGDELGKRETFSFQVQIADIPQPPGAIRLEENVPNTVTVTWDPSASEQWDKNLYYTVLKRESQKGLWHVLGDLIYNNKFTFTRVLPGRDYYFRVVAKNDLGASDPSDTVQPWRIWKKKVEFRVKAQKYRGVNQNQPPRFLVPLRSHVVVTGSECHMSCAVGGHPSPKITWYKDSRDLSRDPNYFCRNDFGVCSLVVLGVTKQDEGEYMVEASNEVGRAYSKAFLAIKGDEISDQPGMGQVKLPVQMHWWEELEVYNQCVSRASPKTHSMCCTKAVPVLNHLQHPPWIPTAPCHGTAGSLLPCAERDEKSFQSDQKYEGPSGTSCHSQGFPSLGLASKKFWWL